ncbi:MAG: hypothetical protein Q9164_004785 [Protoblastenia rupestris]
MPARRLRAGVRVPVSGSAKAFLIVSKERKRTPSFPIDPYTHGTVRVAKHVSQAVWYVTKKITAHTMTKLEQPLYSARGPSLRKTWLTTRKGLRGLVAPASLRNWALVFANSNGYWNKASEISKIIHAVAGLNWPLLTVATASTPPAIPPAIRDTRGGYFES